MILTVLLTNFMEIKKIIFASDDSYFLEFWPVQARLVKKLFGWEPVLFKIDDEDSDFFDDGNGLVKKVKKIEGIHTAIQACAVRMFGTKYFPDEVCVFGDLDMLMINKNYFVDQLKHYSEDSLVIMSSDAYDLTRPESQKLFENEPLPFKQEMYGYIYNVGKGKTFTKVMNLDCSFDEFMNKHRTHKEGYKIMWLIDEFYFADCVNHNNHGVEIVKLKRGHYSEFLTPRRIDRHNFPVKLIWDGEIKNQKKYGFYDVEKLKNGYYIDVNCVRPYRDYKDAIDNLIEIILNEEIKSDMYGLGLKYNTDKILTHRYDRIYEKFLEPLRDKNIKLFEIGCGSEAASFNMWIEYFKNGSIYSMDIFEERNQERGVVYRGDQSKLEDLKIMVDQIGECDIIIDDGSHQPQHQIDTFNYLFRNMLKNGGTYIIEDIECNYWNPKNTIYNYEIGDYNVVDYFSSTPHKINSDFSGLKNHLDIESITHYKNCIIITKKTHEEVLGVKNNYRFNNML
jgi:hypothetical protein